MGVGSEKLFKDRLNVRNLEPNLEIEVTIEEKCVFSTNLYD